VSPLKQLTIPRLELLAATIGDRLAVSVKKEIEQGNPSLFFWSDSFTVIAWIQRQDSWGDFIWNRIQEIRSLTTREAWRHVPGAMNPTDLPSRGCSVRQLLDSKWWEGPPWLKLPPEDWPSGKSQADEDLVKLRTASGVLLRPIQRVYPLEMHEEEPLRRDQMSADMAQETVASLEKDSETKCVRGQTKSGREIKIPSRFRM